MDRPDLVRKVLERVRKDGVVETAKMVLGRLDQPAALGYSCAGVVLEAGAKASGFRAGDRVACAGQNYASHAEIVYVPKNLCVHIPDGVEFEDAAFVTLGAIAMQGVRQAEPRLGDRVAVIGLGLLGQLTVQLLKAQGCIVLGSDIAEDKLELARRLGADVTALPIDLANAATAFSEGHGLDVVMITASTKDNGPIEMAGEIARKKGRVVVVGAVGMNIPREPYYLKELELRLATSYGPGRYDPEYEEKGHDYPYGYVRWSENRNMAAFLDLVKGRRVDVRALASHRFPITSAADAYSLIMEDREPHLGVLLDYPRAMNDAVSSVVHLRKRAKGSENIRIGLIGAGNHVKDQLLPQLRRIDGVEIRGVCTGTGANAKFLGDRLGAAFCTTDYTAVLADADINAVLIGTRHNMHGRMVADALRAGKHVFVEKPLCLTETELKDVRAAWLAAANHGITLTVGFNRRFSSHAQRARNFFEGRNNPIVMSYRVNAGAIPATHWIQDPESGGGRIVGEVCHFVDYMVAICGASPKNVYARRIARHHSGMTDDQSILSLGFSDGSVGTVIYASGGDTTLAKERFEAFGDEKSLVMDDFMLSEFYSRGKRVKFATRNRDKGFNGEMIAFAEAVRGQTEAAIPFEQIEAVTRACLGAVDSLSSGLASDL